MKYYGKTFPIPRDTAWFGEKSYVYSGIRNKPNPMTNALKELRKKAEDKCAYSFNSLLINRYQNGNDKVGWHADDEPELEGCEVIASISLGAAREFKLRKKNYDKQKDTVIDSTNLKLEDNMKEFYKYFKVNDKIRDLEFNKDYLNIFSKDVLKQIKNNTPGWEDKLPEGVSDLIIKKKMFGYK